MIQNLLKEEINLKMWEDPRVDDSVPSSVALKAQTQLMEAKTIFG